MGERVITMGERVVGVELVKAVDHAFLSNDFDTQGKSATNVDAIDRLDNHYRKV